MRLFLIKGNGTFTDETGVSRKYPINKLVLCNERHQEMEIKLDKNCRRFLTYLFNLIPQDTKYEDENGVQCDVFELAEID